MKPAQILSAIFIVPLLLMSFSCHKSEQRITGGGKGGNAILNILPQAHGSYIDTATAYIKYGTIDFPADGVYDDSALVMLVNSQPVITFSGLKVGIYYVFCKGYHTGFSPPTVEGGEPVTISQENTQTITLQLGTYY